MTKLISMTDFVLQRAEESILPLTVMETFKNGAKITNQIFNYANFLNKKLELGMFIPCDDDGDILEKPNNETLHFAEKTIEYKNAKEKCLFYGFNFGGEINNVFVIKYSELRLLYLTKDKIFVNHMRIESLVYQDLTLSETAIKQLGL